MKKNLAIAWLVLVCAAPAHSTDLKEYIEQFRQKKPDPAAIGKAVGEYLKRLDRYQHESPYSPEEINRFLDHAKRVRAAQRQIAEINGSQQQILKFDLLDGEDEEDYTILLPSPYWNRQGLSLRVPSGGDVAKARVFHAKSHGCFKGNLALDPDRENAVKVGMFESGESIPLVVRFSNGVGTYEHDARPDVRGIAIKFWDADKRGSGFNTWDLTLTNSPVPFGRDQEEFVKFLEASVDPRLTTGGSAKLLKFISANFHSKDSRVLGVGQWLVRRTSRAIFMDSLTDETYWSGHPYLMGKDRAAKLLLKPTHYNPARLFDELDRELSTVTPDRFEGLMTPFEAKGLRGLLAVLPKPDTNLTLDWWEMRKDLDDRIYNLKTNPRFDLYAQFDPTQGTELFENGLYVWENEQTKVGTVTLDGKLDDSFCEGLSFNPGRVHPEHRPLTDLGRGRILTYLASALGRGASLNDPSWEKVKRAESGYFTKTPFMLPNRTIDASASGKPAVYCLYPNYDKKNGYAISSLTFEQSKHMHATKLRFYHWRAGFDKASPTFTVPTEALEPFSGELSSTYLLGGWTWPWFTPASVSKLMNDVVAPRTKGYGKWEISHCWVKK